MAQPLQSVSITAPGFAGINTQDAPLTQSPTFAAVADNCVIDKDGRVASRKGYSLLTSDSTPLGSSLGIEQIGEFRDSSGNTAIFSTGNNKIFSGTSTLTDETPGGYSITANNWKIVNFNDSIYFFQRGHEPLVYSNSSGAVETMSSLGTATGTPPEGNECLAALGRLWVADFSSDKSTIYWSDLLNGAGWSGGSSGSIDISKFWPSGYDEIVALKEHNGLLVIFGKDSMLIYEGADSPSTMRLVDTISNIGCVSRDAVVSTGKDLVFLDRSGVRSLGRTVQERSSPVGDISRNVNSDVKSAATVESGNISMCYSPNEAFLLLNFPSQFVTYCFDTRYPLQDGSFRATTWSSMDPKCFTTLADESLYIGLADGIGDYTGNNDNTASYDMRYFSHPLSFDDSSRLKFLKSITLVTFGGASANVVLNWAYDYKINYSKQLYSLPAGGPFEYNIAEYNDAEYSGTSVLIESKKINTSGSGIVASVGVETTVDGNQIAIQQLNIQALLGRVT